MIYFLRIFSGGAIDMLLRTNLDKLYVSQLTLIIIPSIIVIFFVTFSFFYDAAISFAGCADYCFTCELIGDGYCTGIQSSYVFGSLFIVLGLSVVEIILVIGKIRNRKNKNTTS